MDVSASLQLEREAPTPLRHQIADAIRERIQSGRWPLHYKLKVGAELAAELSVSRGTLRTALQTLVQEGLLAQVHGRRRRCTSSRTSSLPTPRRLPRSPGAARRRSSSPNVSTIVAPVTS